MHPNSNSLLQNDLLIVVPFRNEKQHINEIVAYLEIQQLKKDDRCILVDDHSTDGYTFETRVPEKIKFIQLKNEDGIGKKAALKMGILSGNEALILTTDADCTFNEQWSNSMRAKAVHEKQLIIGPVLNEKSTNFITSLQETESIILVHLAKMSVKLNAPIICSGANLLFSRSAFQAVNGYESHLNKSSGDDVLLMRAIFNKFPKSVSFNHDYEALVTTKSETNWEAYFTQRMRWTSKSGHLKSIKGLLLTVILFAALFLPYFLLLKAWFIAVLIPFVEYYYLLKTAHFYRRNFYIGEWFFFRWAYPTLVLATVVLSILPIKVKWKGREVK